MLERSGHATTFERLALSKLRQICNGLGASSVVLHVMKSMCW